MPRLSFYIFFLAAIYTLPSCRQQNAPAPPNILFIAVDDLRPELGAYGASWIKTPNLDRLAAEGRLFTHHFAQVPTCGASRYALLTGTRPHLPEHLGNQALADLLPRQEQKTPESFAHVFKRNGYYTASIGKISHMPDGRLYTYEGEGNGALEMPFSWDEVWGPTGKWNTGWNAFFGYADGSNRNLARGAFPAFEAAAVPDTSYPDGLTALKAIEVLREVQDRSFLLAIGFFKPHLPFTAPQKYWDLYDEAGIVLSPNPEAPAGVVDRSLHDSGEMFGNYAHETRGGAGIRIDDVYAKKLRHAYFASVSFVDAQIGKVLDELDNLGLREQTIVVVWGDHGWHLGDHTIWGKHTTFDRALRSTLIVQTPDMPHRGTPTGGVVETLDLYPTLLDLAGLKSNVELAGESIRPLLENPTHPGKDAALGYWHNRRTLRTERYRFTRYENGGIELFDHATDPYETQNIADQHPKLVASLNLQLDLQHPKLRTN